MSISIDRSTFNQLIDDITADVSNKAEADQISLQQYRNWILRAEQEICRRLRIYEQYALTLTEDVIDYPLQDRPLITAATNATPVQITSAAHGLANGDRINIRDVEGNTAANGTVQIGNKATNTFEIFNYGDITDASNETPISIASANHGRATGDLVTITGVLGNTAANVTENAITVVDVDNFTLDAVAGNGDYTSGGTFTHKVAGSGAYTYGGQYWDTGELPTYVRNIAGIRRTWGNVYRPVKMVGEVDLMNDQTFESTFGIARSGFSNPVEASFININGQRYFHLFARPTATEQCVLICQIEIVPERFFTADVASQITLRSTYNEAIKNYAKAKLYEKLGDMNKNIFYQQAFEFQIKSQKQISVGSARKSITYT